MVRRLGITALAAMLYMGAAMAQSEQIVYIDGAKYTVYTVAKGDTLYSLSKRYGVTIEQVITANPVLTDGLKAGQTIKIPHNTPATGKKQKAEKRSKRQFRTHIVRSGDTLYSIARHYEISVAILMEDNAGVDPAHLAVGQTLYIRRSEMGQTSDNEVREQIEEQKQAMNSVVTTAQYSYHVVHAGENAENIASRFDTTVDELLALNGFNNSSNIREGLIIKVPKPTIKTVEDSTTIVVPEVEEVVEQIKFRNIPKGKRAEVALMLPMAIGERVSQNYIDFYQGFLLGADRLRMEGIESHINLHNTAHDLQVVRQTIDNKSLRNTDLIVGPVYEDTMIPVASYAKELSIPVVSPLANLTQSYDGNIFQMSPRTETKYEKVRNLFDGSSRIVLITSETTDSDFEAEVKGMLEGREYVTHQYIYEHPSVIEKREKEREAGVEVPPSPSDLSPLLEGQSESVFVILAGTEVEVDRILAALASANISLRSRAIESAPFKVFGNSKWNRYRNIDRSLFFSNNVVMLSTYHIDRTNPLISKFSKDYIKSFGSIPSLYAYRGYDVAMIFIRALYTDMEGGLESRKYSPLLTPYIFIEDSNSRVNINNEWVRVNYNSNFTITAE